MFVLIRDRADWAEHQKTNFVKYGRSVVWGKGPAAYPCLVADTVMNGTQGMSCFVYEDDAAELLTASGKPVVSAASSSPSRSEEAQDEFNRHTAACLAAFASLFLETRGVTKEELERRVLMFKGKVDQWTEADKVPEALRAAVHIPKKGE